MIRNFGFFYNFDKSSNFITSKLNIMQKIKHIILIGLTISVSAVFGQMSKQGPSKVEIKQKNGKYRMYVNSQEFYLNGAGCEMGDIDRLAKAGANTFRTWNTENGVTPCIDILNSAQKNNLMVMMGIGMTPVRNGFNYADPVAVDKQFDSIRVKIQLYKDHPAILAWAIGNEHNYDSKGDTMVWKNVNDIAKYIHSVDPNHPVTTPLAYCPVEDIKLIKKYCPDLDFLSFQVYGGIYTLQKAIKESNWTGPYCVTEWGATGQWEVPKTEWGAPIEETSSEKGRAFAERYNLGVKSDTLNCLGSYVFLWGQKQECTPTWYGMFTDKNDEMETVETMSKIWTGKEPANHCPRLDSVKLNGKNAHQNLTVKPQQPMKAIIVAHDLDNDPLEYIYEIMPESTDRKVGGDREQKPETLFKTSSAKNTVEFTAPINEGPYRLFFYARDGKGHSATANIPFFVKK
jgi:hypothetical protein